MLTEQAGQVTDNLSEEAKHQANLQKLMWLQYNDAPNYLGLTQRRPKASVTAHANNH